MSSYKQREQIGERKVSESEEAQIKRMVDEMMDRLFETVNREEREIYAAMQRNNKEKDDE